MKRHLLLVVSTVVFGATRVFAGDLATPVAFVGSQHSAACELVNVTSSPITAQLQLVHPAGAGGVLHDSGPVTVPPGLDYELGPYAFPGDVYCRFVKASKGKARASLDVRESGSDGTTVVIPAS